MVIYAWQYCAIVVLSNGVQGQQIESLVCKSDLGGTLLWTYAQLNLTSETVKP